MPVEYMWDIIRPYGQQLRLSEFANKKIAVNLNGLIYSSKKTSTTNCLPIIYYKIMGLLKQGATPIFVLDGKEPDMKIKKSTPMDQRKIADSVNLLQSMGLKYIVAEGPAEAMCGFLNDIGYVHGCLTIDGDCFLYGAKTAYNYYSVENGGSVTKFTIERIQEDIPQFKNARNTMIALALLGGCDYDNGVKGVGSRKAQQILDLAQQDGEDILERLKRWRQPNFACTICGHQGSAEQHEKGCCTKCPKIGGAQGCVKISKEKQKLLDNELKIRQKALDNPDFPRQEVINEFLINRNKTPPQEVMEGWAPPDLEKFLENMNSISESMKIELKTEWEKVMSYGSMVVDDEAWYYPPEIL